MQMGPMQIGQFQLENLIRAQNKFLFLDLRAVPQPHALLVGSRQIMADEVLAWIHEQSFPSSQPIVLICENGAKSMALASSLELAGFFNVYVVGGGFASLAVDKLNDTPSEQKPDGN